MRDESRPPLGTVRIAPEQLNSGKPGDSVGDDCDVVVDRLGGYIWMKQLGTWIQIHPAIILETYD